MNKKGISWEIVVIIIVILILVFLIIKTQGLI